MNLEDIMLSHLEKDKKKSHLYVELKKKWAQRVEK